MRRKWSSHCFRWSHSWNLGNRPNPVGCASKSWSILSVCGRQTIVTSITFCPSSCLEDFLGRESESAMKAKVCRNRLSHWSNISRENSCERSLDDCHPFNHRSQLQNPMNLLQDPENGIWSILASQRDAADWAHPCFWRPYMCSMRPVPLTPRHWALRGKRCWSWLRFVCLGRMHTFLRGVPTASNLSITLPPNILETDSLPLSESGAGQCRSARLQQS